MGTLDSIKRGAVVQALVFGGFKTGKTVGAYTFPRPNFMEFDRNGLISVVHPDVQKKYGETPGFVFREFVDSAPKVKGIPSTHNAFDDACRYFDEWMGSGKRDLFDTWVIDSGTSLIDAVRLKAVVLLGGGEFTGNKSNTFEQAKKTGLLLPKVQDFGAERSMMEQFVDMILDSGKHALFLCHEREKYNEDDRLVGVGPLLTGQSQEAIPIKFSEVWNLRVKKDGPNVVRYLQTQPDGLRKCGSRLGVPDGTKFEWQEIAKALNLEV